MNEHIKSALITFFVAFALVLIPQIDTISIESFSDGGVIALLFVAVRAGVKALVQFFVEYFTE